MKTIIAGSRSFSQDTHSLLTAISLCPWTITSVVSGGAKGIDEQGMKWALEKGLDCRVYLPDWKLNGMKAGTMRNVEMAEDPEVEALLAVWDGKSTGTKHMIKTAEKNKLAVFVYTCVPNFHATYYNQMGLDISAKP